MNPIKKAALRDLKTLKNVGEVMSNHLYESGITSAKEVLSLGPEECFLRLIGTNPMKFLHGPGAPIYLQALYATCSDANFGKIDAQTKAHCRDFVKKIRASFGEE